MMAQRLFPVFQDKVPAFARAMQLQASGDLSAARQLYLDMVDKPPLTAACLHQLGLIAAVQGDHARAAEIFLRVVRMEPDLTLAYRNLCAALDHIGQPERALGVMSDLACRLYQQKKYAEAEPVFRSALARDPRSFAFNANLGLCVAWLGKPAEATALILRALSLYGRISRDMADFVRRLEAVLDPEFLSQVAPLPDGPCSGPLGQVEMPLTTLSKLFRDAGNMDAAMLCHDMVLKMAPGFALAHWNHAFDLLTRRDFAAGWAEYQWRWKWPEFPEPPRHLSAPGWAGEDLNGKRILIWSEQGLGDTLLFAPLSGWLLQRFPQAKLMLEVPLALIRLLANSFPGIEVIPRSDHPDQLRTDKKLDFTVPLLDLPYLLKLRAENLPMAVNYLKALPEMLPAWQEKLGPHARPRIGLVWASRPYPDTRRSVALERFKPMIEATDADWFSLQVGDRSADIEKLGVTGLTDLSPDLTDFSETAAAVAALDLVITVDTSVAHLAGGMGKPVWVMVLNVADWRWGEDRAETPWYPTMRVFRQNRDEDWGAVVARIHQALDQFCP